MGVNQEHITESNILSYLQGEEISNEVAASLEIWLQTAENRQEAQEIYQHWELSLLASDRPVDVAGGLEVVKSKIETDQSPKQAKVLPLGKIVFAIAASISLIMVAFIWFSPKTETPTEFVTLDLSEQFSLPDSSIATLNENSTLTFYQSSLEQSSGKREFQLKGEGYFEVAHNADRPFIVTTDDAEIKVLGTKFLVQSNAELKTEVLVTEGVVQVTYFETGEVLILKAKEEIKFSKEEHQAKVATSDENKLYWKTGLMKFYEEDLGKVFETLEEEFDVKINIANPRILNCKINASFRKKSLDTIIEVIESTHNLTSKRDGDTIEIEGIGCE